MPAAGSKCTDTARPDPFPPDTRVGHAACPTRRAVSCNPVADPPSPQGCHIITCWLRTLKAGEILSGCGEQHVRKYWQVLYSSYYYPRCT